mmetsp:Transcript_8722/g.12715  ORF Transcript_8722/g.12715 Transcript_8722/m.12715 type:complete len:95 (-) Transcript_8722:1001-1285(-)
MFDMYNETLSQQESLAGFLLFLILFCSQAFHRRYFGHPYGHLTIIYFKNQKPLKNIITQQKQHQQDENLFLHRRHCSRCRSPEQGSSSCNKTSC